MQFVFTLGHRGADSGLGFFWGILLLYFTAILLNVLKAPTRDRRRMLFEEIRHKWACFPRCIKWFSFWLRQSDFLPFCFKDLLIVKTCLEPIQTANMTHVFSCICNWFSYWKGFFFALFLLICPAPFRAVSQWVSALMHRRRDCMSVRDCEIYGKWVITKSELLVAVRRTVPAPLDGLGPALAPRSASSSQFSMSLPSRFIHKPFES